MIKILNTQQIRALDAYTIEKEPIASIDLMERACRSFTAKFTERFDSSNKTGIVCGTGNNGGDGLGIARILKEWGYDVRVWVIRAGQKPSDDFSANLNKLNCPVEELSPEIQMSPFADCDILIDGIFGSGLSRPIGGIHARVIDWFNKAEAIRVAIDIPSGMMADAHSTGAIVRSDFTISFQLPKLAFFQPQNNQFVGEWAVVGIGLKKDFIKNADTCYFQLQRKDARNIRKRRSTFDHKGDYGRALLISGGHGKIGAAVLASRAAMRSGLGLLTVHLPGCGYSILQTAVPEAMVSLDDNDRMLTRAPDTENYDAVGIGPGLGTSPETVKALARLLESANKPLILDADALNILSANPELLRLLPHGCILTPHPKEFERLAGTWGNDFEKLDLLKAFSKAWNAVVVLKGAFSAIAAPLGQVYFNSTGNPGMATGGSGDVLTGILTGLRAQGYDPLQTALLGVYVHGLSGDFGVIDKGMEGLIASDIIDYLPQAFGRI
jgi:ADP-dependent NAD(P)H-hydrate dehydratase / NAD(P)H-hydrate epimerase